MLIAKYCEDLPTGLVKINFVLSSPEHLGAPLLPLHPGPVLKGTLHCVSASRPAQRASSLSRRQRTPLVLQAQAVCLASQGRGRELLQCTPDDTAVGSPRAAPHVATPDPSSLVLTRHSFGVNIEVSAVQSPVSPRTTVLWHGGYHLLWGALF